MLPRLNSQVVVRLFVAIISVMMMCYVLLDTRHAPIFPACQPQAAPEAPTCSQDKEDIYQVSRYVNGPPTESLFDNLRNDTRYLTSFLNAGWTNDVMTIVNTIYLGMLTDRVPVIPPHVPMHVGLEAEDFIFSEIFDLQRLRQTIRHPIIEWKDVKTGIGLDHIGCWTVWKTAEGPDGSPRGSRLQHSLHLDISYSTVPDNTKLLNRHNSYWGLAKLGFPDGRAEALRDTVTLPSELHKRVILPDDQLMCFDILYYVAGHDPFEWERDYSPAWRFVGRHLHFNPNMVQIAEEYLYKAFNLDETDNIPRFISVHMRRGDFAWECEDNKNTCFPPVSVIAEHVGSMQTSLWAEYKLNVRRILVTSDEKDPAWWAEIEALGWNYVDHAKEKTAEELGRWYPAFIDGIHQSMGTGFIGTEGSTMSLVALRRVVEWNGGMGMMIKFGKDMYA